MRAGVSGGLLAAAWNGCVVVLHAVALVEELWFLNLFAMPYTVVGAYLAYDWIRPEPETGELPPGVHRLGPLVHPVSAVCPLCGDALRGSLRRCEECEAELHPECWRYIGGCGTYGCPSARRAA